jgi:hypothetical protein
MSMGRERAGREEKSYTPRITTCPSECRAYKIASHSALIAPPRSLEMTSFFFMIPSKWHVHFCTLA